MKVTFDNTRLLHLFLLIAFSYLGGYLLVSYLEWTPLSAFGFACTVVCQVSNVILKVFSEEGMEMANVNDSANIKTLGNPKKRKKNKAA